MNSKTDIPPGDPAIIVEYTDALEGFKGWLVIDALQHRLAAGGMRVQQTLTREHVIRMARNMTLKMKIAGLRVDGAKSGIAYDPDSPGKKAAMTRFMKAIRPYVMTCYSMGPDLNVQMAELEDCGRQAGLASVKMAIANAQGWDLPYFLERYNILEQRVDGWPLGKLRAGYGVAMAAIAVASMLDIPINETTVAIQGFGSVAKAAARTLYLAGAKIIAVADEEKCYISKNRTGLPMDQLLEANGALLPDRVQGNDILTTERDSIFDVPCTILLPAATEHAITEGNWHRLKVRAVAPGANLAVTQPAAGLLHANGILVLPDFVAGCGGSLSMNGLFGPKNHPSPEEVLAHIKESMTRLVHKVLHKGIRDHLSPLQAALQCCQEEADSPDSKPYGPLP